MNRGSLFTVCVLSLCIGAQASAAVLFDFESPVVATSLPRAGSYTSLTMTEDGLTTTIRRATGAAFDVVLNVDSPSGFQSGKPAGWLQQSLDPFFSLPDDDFWIADFSHAIKSASIEYGDYGEDNDIPVVVAAYSDAGGTGTLVSSSSANWLFSDAFPEFDSLSVQGSGINSITFESSRDRGATPNSLFWDNLSVELDDQQPILIPEPSTMVIWSLLGSLGIAFGSWRVRRSK